MKEALDLIRTQSVVLVDMFAAAFLFIFVAFLMLYTMFLLSIDHIENRTAGGWKVISASPFTTEQVTTGLAKHADEWANEAFIEFHADRLVTYARTYREPEVFDMSRGADPEPHLRSFLRTVRRNYERLGPTSMAEAGYGLAGKPSVNMYVFDSRHYYKGRDLIQDKKLSWAEFAVPSEPGQPADGVGDGTGTINADSYSQDWKNILQTLKETSTPKENVASSQPDVTPLELVPLDEREITVRMLELEPEQRAIVDRLVPLLFLLALVPLLAEAMPYYRQFRARVRLRKALRSRTA